MRKLVTHFSLRLGLELSGEENCIELRPILSDCKVRNPQNLAGNNIFTIFVLISYNNICAMSRLDQLYKAMQTLNSEGLVLNEDLLNQVSELEEKIIKNEFYQSSEKRLSLLYRPFNEI